MQWQYVGRMGLVVMIGVHIVAGGDARADEDNPRLRFGVFGTLGAVYHEAQGVEYRRSDDQPRGARSGKLEFGTDSVLGAQVNARATDQFDVVVQAVSRLFPNNTWAPDANWAFVRYSPDPALSVRLGRVGIDTQVDADSRFIGYSYLPIRPSQELLTTVPVDFLDGIDVTLRRPVGDGVVRVKALYGVADSKAYMNGAEITPGRSATTGLILGYETTNWQVRMLGGYAHVKSNGDGQALVDALRGLPAPFAAQGRAAADALDNTGENISFLGADFAYDNGPVKMQASYLMQSARDTKVLIPDARAISALAGYRLRCLTSYVTYGRVIRDSVTFSTGLPSVGGLAQLNAGADTAVASAQADQRSIGLGARYDFVSHFAVKFQVDRVRAGYSPVISDTQRPAGAPKHLTLFSATLDFAF